MINKDGVKLLVMDVDGTLTDGKIYMGPTGEICKTFDVKDGYAIANILPEIGIKPAIITGRQSPIAQRRAEELKIEYIYQGVSDKASKLQWLAACLNIHLRNLAYMGDDCNDLSCMRLVRLSGGVTACPADAANAVKKICTYICSSPGGRGAVREFICWLARQQERQVPQCEMGMDDVLWE